MTSLHYIKDNSTAIGISLIYVLLGGIVACSLYPDDPLNGDWWFFGWIITFPVNIVSCSFRGFGSTDYLPVIIIQTLMFIPTFILIQRLLAKKKRN